MGSHPSNHPLNRGFDHFFGFLSGGHNYFPEELVLNDLKEVTRMWEWYRTRLLNDHQRVDIDDYLTDALTDAANAFIDKQADSENPFLLYLAYNAPHSPLQATEKYLSRFPNIKNKNRRTYAAMVSALDDGVGRVLANLRRHGIEEETIVVFLSDNGGSSKFASDNTPLRGWKSDLFEGGIRVPFAMQWKGTIPAGMDYNNPVISLDIMGTIAALAGVEISEERPLDGVNLVPFLTGKKDGMPHKELFWRKREHNGMAIRRGNMKLVSNSKYEKNNYELFDLETDLSEAKNQRYLDSKMSSDLKKSWETWNAQLKDRTFPTLMEDQWWKR
jgi:arylsulfatase A-like enzyme